MSRSDKDFVVHISTGTIFRVLAIVAVLFFLWYVKEIVVMLFVALMLAALVEPFADLLHRYKIPRGFSVLAVYIVLFAILTVSLLLVIPPLINQTQNLLANFSSIFVGVSDTLSRVYAFGEQYGFKEDIVRSIDGLRASFGHLVSGLFSTITGLIGSVVSVVIVLVLAFYMVVEEDAWRRLFRRVAPDEYQPYLTQLFNRMQKKIGLWLRGQLLLMLIVGTATYLGLLALHVEYALVLGLFAGVMEIIPYAGPTIGAIPAVILAFVESPVKGVIVLLLYIVIQQTENHFLVPKIMQKVTGLNPIISIVALLVGFKVAGIAGAALAIPVATLLSVFANDILGNESGDL